jgi:general secretion pathway protein K
VIVNRLRPYVTALSSITSINVNTAPPEVVRVMTPGMTLSGAEELARNKPADGYETVDAFLDEPAFNGLDGSEKEALKPLLSVRTDYFELAADARISNRHSMLHAVLARGESGTLRIVTRDYGRQFSSTTNVPSTPSAGMTTTETR